MFWFHKREINEVEETKQGLEKAVDWTKEKIAALDKPIAMEMPLDKSASKEVSQDSTRLKEAESDKTEVDETRTKEVAEEVSNEASAPELDETGSKELTDEEKQRIKEESGWSDEIIDNIKNMDQYEILKNAELIETEINGKKCLIRKDFDLDYTDQDGISNRERIARGNSPFDSKTGEKIQLHHLGQKADSPLVELTETEHRTGKYKGDKKNQFLWHDNTKETEVHGEGNNWDPERKAHWKARAAELELRSEAYEKNS